MAVDVQRLASELTPQGLERTIRALAACQAHDQRQSVMLNGLWDVLVGEELASGAKGWADYLAFKRTVVRLVGELPGMHFVEADS